MINAEVLINTLKGDYYLSKSSLGAGFLIFKISHRKAVNKLLKNDFERCLNKDYIQHKNIKDFVLRFSPVIYKFILMFELSLKDYDHLKNKGIQEGIKNV